MPRQTLNLAVYQLELRERIPVLADHRGVIPIGRGIVLPSWWAQVRFVGGEVGRETGLSPSRRRFMTTTTRR